MAATVGRSRRQLLRRFRSAMGVTTKTAERILRFRRAARRVRTEPERALSALAVSCGYADQAHMTREFARLAGTTPAAYRADGSGSA